MEEGEKDSNHDNNNKEDNGNSGDCENEDDLKNEGKEKSDQEGDKPSGSEVREGEVEEGELVKENREPDIFSLAAVNAYGSQEVRKFEDKPEKVYTITSEFPGI